MTISSETRKAGPFTGNGITATFPFTFKVFQASDLKVVRADLTGAETILVQGTDYTVSLNANQDSNPGGSIVLPAALTSGFLLAATSKVPNTQPMDLTNQGGFYPKVINNAMDRLEVQIQQVALDAASAVRVPLTSSVSVEELTADLIRLGDSADNIDTVAGNIGAVNTNATNIAAIQGASANAISADASAAASAASYNSFRGIYYGAASSDPTVDPLGNAPTAGDLYFNSTTQKLRVYGGTTWQEGNAGSVGVQQFSGTGAQTAFSLTSAPLTENNTQVYIGGVYQQKDRYDVSGTTLTFVVAPPSGTNNIEVVTINTLPLGATDASLVNFAPAGAGAVARTAQDKMVETVSVKDFGAVGDGVADDTAAIQAAIDYVAGLGGGVIRLPSGNYRCNVVIKDNVTLTSLSTGTFGYLASGTSKGVILTQAAAGFVVDTPATGIANCAVVGINFKGLGAGTAGGGIRFQNVGWSAVKQCHFDTFADQAILKNAGNANTFEDILTTNVLLNRTRSVVNGCIELAGGADDFLSRIEANPSLTSGVSDANLRVCGIVIKAFNVFASNCIGEFADYGIYTTGNFCRLVNCRADLNKGGGFYCNGGSLYSNCLALNNGQAAANTYDGFYVNGQGDSFSNCSSQSTVGSVRYGFYDPANYAQVSSRNKYVNCTANNYGTAVFYTEGFLGSSPMEPGIPLRDTSTAPDTTGSTFVVLTHGSATTITNFLGGYSGKTIQVLGNANVTIENNANIVTNINANKTLTANRVYTFTRYNGKWYELQTQQQYLEASLTYDPPSIANGSAAFQNVTVTGAELGDLVIASFSRHMNGMVLGANVSATNTVTCVMANNTGVAVDIASGTLKVRVIKS